MNTHNRDIYCEITVIRRNDICPSSNELERWILYTVMGVRKHNTHTNVDLSNTLYPLIGLRFLLYADKKDAMNSN